MPRLMVPSSGGGTKLMRTFLGGEAEGVCSGDGEGVTDSSGRIEEAGDSSGIAEGDGPCAKAAEAKRATRNTRLAFFVIVLVAALYERRISSATVTDRRYS